MKVFRQRESFLENITLMALMAAIVIIVSLFTAFVPLGAVIIMIALPLPSAIVSFFTKPKYYAIYIFGAVGLALAVTAWNLSGTIFYVIPAILSGTLYGFLRKKGAGIPLTIFFVALLNMGLSYLSILLIKAIYEVDMIAFILKLIGLAESETAPTFMMAAIFTFSLIQTSISNLFIAIVSEPIKEFEKENKLELFYPLFGLALLATMLILSFFENQVSFALLVGSTYWAVFSLIETIPTVKKWVYIPTFLLFAVGIFLFYFFFASLPLLKALLLLGGPIAGLLIGALINNALLFKKGSHPTIKG